MCSIQASPNRRIRRQRFLLSTFKQGAKEIHFWEWEEDVIVAVVAGSALEYSSSVVFGVGVQLVLPLALEEVESSYDFSHRLFVLPP